MSHNIDAVVELCTNHRDKFGDSLHHALADEVARLREAINREALLMRAVRLALQALNEHQPDGFTLASHSSRATSTLKALTYLHAGIFSARRGEESGKQMIMGANMEMHTLEESKP